MTTLVKIIVTTLLSLSLFSCNFDMNFGSGIRGNGHVEIEERKLNQSFTAIKVSEGLNVYLTQGERESLIIEADENLHNLIITEIEDGVLKIHTKKNIGHASSKKVMVTFKDVSTIMATSGSNVYSSNTITTDRLELKTSSGSDMKLDINTSELDCNSSSGSDMYLSGKTDKLIADVSSGSSIKATNLIAEYCQVAASSGANMKVNTCKELMANASSGGNITYIGNPEKIIKNNSTSGKITRQ